MNNTNYLFIEDARKYKRKVLIIMIICYILFAICAALLITSVIINNSLGENWGLGIAIICILLLFAVYFNWAYFSKYLKYYMYIDENEIKFFANNIEHTMPLEQLISFNILKSNNKYTIVKLNFKNEEHYEITTFKFNEFQNILNYLLNKK